ncbi:MAG: hypothetical protein Q8R47_02605 [Nanoarchaeota archaeon]|nr:hypothetical protein [Nanoarchaeota archaeon]
MDKKQKSALGPLNDEEKENKQKIDKILGPIEDVTFDDLFESARQKAEQYDQELRAKAKTEEELTVGLECVVESVNFYQRTGRATDGEVRYGGPPISSYKTGHFLHTELSVKSDSLVQKLPLVQKLQFNGWPHFEAGDTIRAYILKGKKEAEKGFGRNFHSHHPKTHLVERDYQPIEQPSKIEKLRDGKVVATYHNS